MQPKYQIRKKKEKPKLKTKVPCPVYPRFCLKCWVAEVCDTFNDKK